MPKTPQLNKRHFTMLEVLIAFVLVVLCAVPLIYPHVAMLKAQRQFVRKMELNHAVNVLYGHLLEKLYLNKINWFDLSQKQVMEVTDEMWREAHVETPFPYKGSFLFTEDNHKPATIGNFNLFQFTLLFTFVPIEFKNEELKKAHTMTYKYKVFIVRDLRPPEQTQAP